MEDRPNLKKLLTTLFEGAGTLATNLRRTISTHAGVLSGQAPPEDLPLELARYTEKVARRAYQITNEDIAALQASGYSEDQIFEATISAAVGASLARLRIVTKLLQEA